MVSAKTAPIAPTAYATRSAAAGDTQFLRLALSSRAALSAEVLFLRKQRAFYHEHQIPARKLNTTARFL